MLTFQQDISQNHIHKYSKEFIKTGDRKYVYCSNGYDSEIMGFIDKMNMEYTVANVEITEENLEDIIKKIYR